MCIQNTYQYTMWYDGELARLYAIKGAIDTIVSIIVLTIMRRFVLGDTEWTFMHIAVYMLITMCFAAAVALALWHYFDPCMNSNKATAACVNCNMTDAWTDAHTIGCILLTDFQTLMIACQTMFITRAFVIKSDAFVLYKDIGKAAAACCLGVCGTRALVECAKMLCEYEAYLLRYLASDVAATKLKTCYTGECSNSDTKLLLVTRFVAKLSTMHSIFETVAVSILVAAFFIFQRVKAILQKT
jgi:hypothetical protein